MGRTIIHCVRHAQGYHNLNAANHLLPDPDLTPLGKSQCVTVSRTFPAETLPRITHFLASPLRRTIYTGLLSFPTLSERLPIIALPLVQELSDLPCDTGSEPGVLAKEFGKGEVDLGLVKEGWNVKVGEYSPASSALERRARKARLFLRDLAEGYRANPSNHISPSQDIEMILVTHGGFLHYFTEDWEGTGKFSGTGWANCEFRSYEILEGEGASLRELKECREGRRGKERDLGNDEQRELRAAAEAEWVESGFQKVFGKGDGEEGEVDEVDLEEGEFAKL